MSNEQLIFKNEQVLIELMRTLSKTSKIRVLKRMFLKITILEIENDLIILKKIRDNNRINLN
jgi:hypothetical protein